MGKVVEFRPRPPSPVAVERAPSCRRIRNAAVCYRLEAHPGAVSILTSAQELWLSPEQAATLALELVSLCHFASGGRPVFGREHAARLAFELERLTSDRPSGGGGGEG
jgi:hypothetical protein